MENIKEWSFKKLCFEEKEKNTHIILQHFVKYQTEGKSSQLPGAGTVEVASFLSLRFYTLLTEFITFNSFMTDGITSCVCVIESYTKMCSWSVALYWAIFLFTLQYI